MSIDTANQQFLCAFHYIFFIFFFFLFFYGEQIRDEKIADSTKLLESGKISVQDFLNRMLWNDEELIKFFGDFEAVDPCDEGDVSEYESEDETMDESDSP